MKISRHARDKYQFHEEYFAENGDALFSGDVHKVRKFVQQLNQKRDLISYPELAAKTSDVYTLTLISEIKGYVYQLYLDQIQNSNLAQELYEHLEKEFDSKTLLECTKSLIEEFPPDPVYKNQIESEKFLEMEENGIKNNIKYLPGFIELWLINSNPAFSQYMELYDDENLEKRTQYLAIVENIRTFMESKPKFTFSGTNIIDTLRNPELKSPHSIRDQLKYIQENWSEFIGKWGYLVLTGMDLIQEEEKMRGFGPGKIQPMDFYGLDIENYTADSAWMPNVIMVAKNAYVWLGQLSKQYNREIIYLNQIPNEELDQLVKWGFTSLWLIGLWERSPASKTIKNWCGNSDAEASAYSLYDYEIAADLGGYLAYQDLKDRASQRGLRLASDMVPNHTGIDSKWMRDHPDWYVQLPYPPFPSYQYSGADLCGDSNIGVYLEDKYFSRTDAAVSFKRVDFRSGDTRYIYHGNDGTSMPWNDTAQLNFLNPEVREAVIQKILDVARMFPIIRFDAAMTLTRKHFQRLWFPEPGTGGDIPSRAGMGMTKEEFMKKVPEEFWREVVERIRTEVPDTLLLAEAFWLLEGFFVRTLGMHRVYNSIFMNALRDEENSLYRGSIKKALEFDRRMLQRFVNFMNNPDEETASVQFGTGEKYFGICLLLVTMPGLPMFGHGQVQGYKEKYGMEFRRAYWDETEDRALLHHHEQTIFPIMQKRYLFAQADNYYLYDFWAGNVVNEDVYAFSNMVGNERGFVVYNNRYSETSGYVKNSVGYNENGIILQKELASAMNIPREGYSIFKDYMSKLEYIRKNQEIQDKGLYFELKPYQSMCFLEWKSVQDNEFSHYSQLYNMLGGKGVHSIDDALKEMVYKPILTPFRELFNAGLLKQILVEKTSFIEIKPKIEHQLKLLINETRRFVGLDSNGDALVLEILNKLHNFIEFAQNPPSLDNVDDLTPSTHAKWAMFFGWVLTRELGKVKNPTDFSLLSRSWVEEWHLGSVIHWVLGEICQENEKIEEYIYLLKILIGYQNWDTVLDSQKANLSYFSLKPLLSDPEVQNFLGFNRYQESLWFNEERMRELLKGLFMVSYLKNYSEDHLHPNPVLVKIYQKWKESVLKSKFKLASFIDNIKNGNN
ncbi:hypothetical protein NEF87_004031 [Candidatus Lokiarchaeum ossiferum]|uniref:Glycosyl hydrolase family 13 catalytic domain-containing protein n=1 Tax=Candidatus Lokiarchaeum ossiferum TaxID=2951803 RepID=A0ABY6HYU5_9ARCH|nr:hypothetical protein NEF87_004031 [Candidatus Lokiarchaeum sp. B-35]